MAQTALQKFRNHKPALLGLYTVVIITLLCLAAPIIAPSQPWESNLEERLESPSSRHLMGTDDLGRDIFSRVLYGGRISIFCGVFSIMIGLVFGGLIGIVAGYFGGKVELILMRLTDVFLAFPSILLAISIAAILGSGITSVVLAVGIRSIPSFSRMMHGRVLSIKNNEYCEAASAMGASHTRIMAKAILPNVLSTILVFSTLQIAHAILLGGVLNFIGLGVSAPTPEWGKMVSDGRNWLSSAPYISTFPGLVILLIAMGFNLIGDGLRDCLDPKMSS